MSVEEYALMDSIMLRHLAEVAGIELRQAKALLVGLCALPADQAGRILDHARAEHVRLCNAALRRRGR
jgi:hypothetical protein